MRDALSSPPLPVRALLVVFAAAALALLAFATAAHAATTWYAAPAGSGTACTQPNPCDVVYALETKPADGDTVVLSGGDYAIPEPSFGIFVERRISIEGPTSGTPARLIADPGLGTVLNLIPSSGPTLPVHVTGLQIQMQPGYGFGATNNGSAEMVIDRIRVDSPGGSGIPIALSQAGSGLLLLRNSISRVTAGGSIGINVFGPDSGSGEVQLRNVTVDVPTATGRGLVAQGGQNYGTSCGALTVDVKNSYLRGGAPERDVRAFGGTGVISDPPCASIVNSSNSNWRSSESATGGIVNSNADQHNVDASFVNAAGGDYRQLAGSPTIDNGVADRQLGSVDFEGEARLSGTAPDIGVDELPQQQPIAPKAPAGTHSSSRRRGSLSTGRPVEHRTQATKAARDRRSATSSSRPRMCIHGRAPGQGSQAGQEVLDESQAWQTLHHVQGGQRLVLAREHRRRQQLPLHRQARRQSAAPGRLPTVGATERLDRSEGRRLHGAVHDRVPLSGRAGQ